MWALYVMIKKLISALQGGTGTVESIITNQEAILDAQRSASSGTTTMGGTAQTLYEYVPTASSEFLGGNIDLTNMAIDDIIVIDIYKKIKSGGAYVLCQTTTYTAVQAVPLIEIAGNRFNRYSIKVVATQTQATTSYKAVDFEFYDAAPGL